MIRNSIAILSVATILLLVLNVKAADVPSAHDGFTWKHVDTIKAAFLLPDGWHYLEEDHGKTLSIFLSKENISENTVFDTGVTINVFRGNPSAPKQLKNIIEGLAEKHGSTVSQELFEPFVRFNTRYDSVRKSDSVKMRTLDIVLVNVNTKTSYLIIFESPVSLWDKNWPIGEKIINNLALESEI